MNNFFDFVQYINSIKEERFRMNTLYKISLVISIIGCLNWGLVGIFNFNLVEFLFGDGTILTRLVYILVAISGIIDIGILTKDLDR